jgi:hypothetical protein
MTIKYGADFNGIFEGSEEDKDLSAVGEVLPLVLSESQLPIQKFLYAMQVKGARVCEDIQVTNNGDVFLNDGTSLSSIVKELEIVFGTLVGDVFTSLDPANKFVNSLNSGTQDLVLDPVSDSMYGGDTVTLSEGVQVTGTAAAGKWYLKMMRPNGMIVYKELKGINDMFGSTMDDKINSIPEVLKQLHDLGVAVKTVMDQNQLSRMQDVDKLEWAWDRYIQDLKAELDDLQTEFKETVSVRDLAIYNHMIGRLNSAKQVIQGTMDNDYGHASISFAVSTLQTPSGYEATFALSNATGDSELRSSTEDAARHDIKNWIVKAVVRNVGSSTLVNDSIWHRAYISGEELKVLVRAVDASGVLMDGSRYVEVTAAYCGPRTNADAFSTPGDLILADYTSQVTVVEPENQQDSDLGTSALTPAIKLL